MPTITYPFTVSSNYDFDNTVVEVSSGTGKLKLIDFPGLDFVEDFADDTGFVYDSDRAEFVDGSVRQKDQTNGAISGARYETTINLEAWSGGSVTGTAVGGASISANRLDLASNDVRYVDYVATGNFGTGNVGCIRMKYTPNYTIPDGDKTMYVHCKTMGVVINNFLMIRHQGTRRIQILAYNSTGSVLLDYVTANPWVVASGTTYEIELNYDFTNGATRIFINGVQFGATQTDTGTIDKSQIDDLRIGGNYGGTDTSNFFIEDLLIFDTVQHTENYTPGYTVPEYRYAASTVILPEMVDEYPGTLVSFDEFITTETGSPKYTLQIGRSGNYLYWGVATWDISDGTYPQSTDAITFDVNAGSLDVEGEIYGQFKIHFNNSNTLSSVGELTATLTAQQYSDTSPTIVPNTSFFTDLISEFMVIEIIDSNTEITCSLSKNGTCYYHNGTAWVQADGTVDQSNSESEINANIASFISGQQTVKVKVFLTGCCLTTPQIDSIIISYDFAGTQPATRNTCIVYGHENDIQGLTTGDTIKVYLNKDMVVYKGDQYIKNKTYTTTVGVNGYWEIELVENTNMTRGSKYIFNFGSNIKIDKYVPDVSSARFTDLTG